MPKCPYCKNELHIEDFFKSSPRMTITGKKKVEEKDFKGEKVRGGRGDGFKMWVCPLCDTILGFSEYGV